MSIHTTVFDESKFKVKSRIILGTREVPTIIKFLVIKGIIKKEKHALFVVFLTIIMLMTGSVFLVKKSLTVPVAIISPQLILGIK